MKKVKLRDESGLVITTHDPSCLCLDGEIDTGEQDGSGEITVRAIGATSVTEKEFVFHDVTVEVSGNYETWSDKDLASEAMSMLMRDYIEEIE